MDKKSKKNDAGGLFIPGGTLLGLGIGLVFGQPGAGLLIGVGAGFIVWGLLGVLGKSSTD
ncbi:hypothetical protein IT415_03085 [bacterium]|nr:hypothetical protein [bacterium]